LNRREVIYVTKTLLEHHYELRLEALRDDPEHGWKWLCDYETINIKMQNIYTA
jgi:hypothetical protein